MNKYDDQIERLALNPLSFSPVSIIGNVGSGKTYFLEKYRAQRQNFYKPAFEEWEEGEGAKIFNADEICKAIHSSFTSDNESAWIKMFDSVDVYSYESHDEYSEKYHLWCAKRWREIIEEMAVSIEKVNKY